MDVHEDKQGSIVTATFELPGLKKEDVSLDVHNNVLTVSGESRFDSERNEDGYAVRERRYGKFSRSLPLPQGVKASTITCHSLAESLTDHANQNEEIKASMDSGVLTVTFPKSAPEATPKKLVIS